ncbi:MAG TPA: hypothetical protein VMW20_04945 [Candidatus Nanoarchaeia archaeon]|nr:hypothetical protein [Candidatus Nanoarchaeia archaeon]
MRFCARIAIIPPGVPPPEHPPALDLSVEKFRVVNCEMADLYSRMKNTKYLNISGDARGFGH